MRVGTNGYRADIDGLRAIAILSVVGFHVMPNYLPGGFVGVDVFFVISGFLISGIIFRGQEKKTFSFVNFYARRIRRIFPALAVVLVAVLLLGYNFLLPDEFVQLGRNMAAGAGFVANLLLWHESGYFAPSAELNPLTHLWSLGVEEQYYIIWPPLVWLTWRFRSLTLVSILSIAAASFAYNAFIVGRYPAEAFFSPATRFWELMIGSALAYTNFVGAFRYSSFSKNILSVAGALLIAGALIFINRDIAYPGWLALLPTLGAAFIILAGEQAWVNFKILRIRAVVLVGLISYPLYLWHWPLLSFLRITSANNSDEWIGKGVVVILSFVLAYLTYRLIELPIRASAKTHMRLVPSTLVVTVAALGSAGLYVMKADGLPGRLPSAAATIVNYAYDDVTGLRVRRCDLDYGQHAADFLPECDGDRGVSKQVFIWGDSTAAHLYPGLKSALDPKIYAISQYTGSSCPPLLFGYEFDPIVPTCRERDEFVARKIAANKPDIVIMSFLVTKNMNKIKQAEQIDGLFETAAYAKRAGAKKVLLIGPGPQFRERIPGLVVRKYLRNPRAGIPTRLNIANMLAIIRPIDNDLRRRAAVEGVGYVSLLDAMCGEVDCRVMVYGIPAFWDSVHLTDAGSLYFSYFIAPLFENIDLDYAAAAKAADDANTASLVPPSFSDLLKRGNEDLDHGDRAGAHAKFAKALELWPTNIQMRQKLLSTQVSLGDFTGALYTANAGLALFPNNGHFLAWRGEIKHNLKRNAEALVDYNAAIAAKLDAPDVYAKRASIRSELGDLAGAFQDWSTFVRIAQDDAGRMLGHVMRAQFAQRLERWDDALADYDALIAAKPHDADLNAKRKFVLEQIKRTQDENTGSQSLKAQTVEPGSRPEP